MAERKLAYIATISKLDKIPDKDRIVYASFKGLGWQVIVDVANKTGNKIVYIEIDSILPVKPEYEFLRKRCFSEKQNGYVISGMRMAGLISYGLVLPVPQGYEDKEDGYDMTDILEIRKKEDSIPEEVAAAPKSKFLRFLIAILWKLGIKIRRKNGKIIHGVGIANEWLSFAHKTDETRIENLSYLFIDKFKGTPVYTTVKCDGQSLTFAIYKFYFFIACRNTVVYRKPLKVAIRELNPESKSLSKMNNYRKIAAIYDIPGKLNWMGDSQTGIVLQGELCGPGIQNNTMGLSEVDFFIFNIYYPIRTLYGGVKYRDVYLSWGDIEEFCEGMGFKTVPFIERRRFDWTDKAALKEYAKGKYPNGNNREGVVIRYDTHEAGYMPKPLRGMSNMWSFKCINDDYVLDNMK
jgi:hypothetical protein